MRARVRSGKDFRGVVFIVHGLLDGGATATVIGLHLRMLRDIVRRGVKFFRATCAVSAGAHTSIQL